MKHQLLLFFLTILNSTAATMAHTHTQQIFNEIAATKYVLEHKVRQQLTGCNEQTYFDSYTGDVHQDFNNAVGWYDIVFCIDGSIVINTKYKKIEAPIVHELNNLFFFQNSLKPDAYTQCYHDDSAYKASCRTTLTQAAFDAHMLVAEQQPNIKKLEVLG